MRVSINWMMECSLEKDTDKDGSNPTSVLKR